MTQFVVRKLEVEVKTRLKARAQQHGRSMEAEVREILRVAAMETSTPVVKLGSRIAAQFSTAGGLPKELPELRGQSARAALLTDAPKRTKARKS